jgi:hypothetical protein
MLRIATITEHKSIFRTLGLQGAYGEEAMRTMKSTKKSEDEEM